MRWLLIVFLVSLGALLLAAAGLPATFGYAAARTGKKFRPQFEPAEKPNPESESLQVDTPIVEALIKLR